MWILLISVVVTKLLSWVIISGQFKVNNDKAVAELVLRQRRLALDVYVT